MMSYSKIEIKTKGEAPSVLTEIMIDGHLIKGVRNFELKQSRNDGMPILTLDLNALDISADCEILKINHEQLGEIKEIIFN